MAGNDDGVHIFGVFLVGEEDHKHVDQLIQGGLGLLLDLGGAHVEKNALAEHDVAVIPDGDLGGVAHDPHHAVPDLLQDRQPQHRNGLHLAAHGHQLLGGGLHVLLLVGDQRPLLVQQPVLAGQLLLLLNQGKLGGVQIHRDLVQLCLGVRHLLQGQRKACLGVLQLDLRGGELLLGAPQLLLGLGQMQPRLRQQGLGGGQTLLRLLQSGLGVLQVVAGDEVLDVAQQHHEKQDQRHGGHHVRVAWPEALFPVVGADKGLGAALKLPSHAWGPPLGAGSAGLACLPLPLPPSMRRLISRMAPARSRTARSMRSTLPRRL